VKETWQELRQNSFMKSVTRLKMYTLKVVRALKMNQIYSIAGDLLLHAEEWTD
jgi:hypothetical protein